MYLYIFKDSDLDICSSSKLERRNLRKKKKEKKKNPKETSFLKQEVCGQRTQAIKQIRELIDKWQAVPL